MFKRRRFKRVESLQNRLARWANRLREQADKLPDGPERDALLKKLRQTDTSSHIEGWPTLPDCSRRMTQLGQIRKSGRQLRI
jgi:hypothetical protein